MSSAPSYIPKSATAVPTLKGRVKYGIAVVPTRPIPRNTGGMSNYCAMVPMVDEEKHSLSSLLDSREHWWISRYLKAVQRVPPITGTYVMLSTVMSLLSWAFNENYPLEVMQFDLQRLKRGEMWRILTPFLNFGQLWLGHLFMAQSVLLYMSSVEIAHCTRPEKFLEFMAFGAAFLSMYGVAEALAGRQDSTMSSAAYHLHTYVLYYWSRLNEGSVVNCFDMFNLPAESVPFLFLLQNYLLYREFYVSDLAAIAAAHFYYYFLSNSQVAWPLQRLRTGSFKKLYQRFDNEISR